MRRRFGDELEGSATSVLLTNVGAVAAWMSHPGPLRRQESEKDSKKARGGGIG